jgi:hypothetical protein
VLEVSALTARRYVMAVAACGRAGAGAASRGGTAMRAMEDLQLDPLVVVARAHDLMLHSRVADYTIDDWATLTYERREFFDWGGWLAVRPMDELPYFRVLMRRERKQPRWIETEREHHDAIEEMRAVLRAGREVSNRDFAMSDRTRVDHYRGGKDSALALHYLWRVGEAMVTRRERFERVYALTEAVAPPSRCARSTSRGGGRPGAQGRRRGRSDAAERDRLQYATATRQPRRSWRIGAPLADRRLLIEGPVEGWRAIQVALGADAGDPGRARGGPDAGRLGADRDDDRGGGDLPVAARPGQRARPRQAVVRLRLRVGGLQAGREAVVRLLHDADPVGRPAGRPLRPEARPDDRHARRSTACGSRTTRSPATRRSATR